MKKQVRKVLSRGPYWEDVVTEKQTEKYSDAVEALGDISDSLTDNEIELLINHLTDSMFGINDELIDIILDQREVTLTDSNLLKSFHDDLTYFSNGQLPYSYFKSSKYFPNNLLPLTNFDQFVENIQVQKLPLQEMKFLLTLSGEHLKENPNSIPVKVLNKIIDLVAPVIANVSELTESEKRGLLSLSTLQAANNKTFTVTKTARTFENNRLKILTIYFDDTNELFSEIQVKLEQRIAQSKYSLLGAILQESLWVDEHQLINPFFEENTQTARFGLDDFISVRLTDKKPAEEKAF